MLSLQPVGVGEGSFGQELQGKMDLRKIVRAKRPTCWKILDSSHDSQRLSWGRSELVDGDAGCCTEQKRYGKPTVPVEPAQHSALR